MRIRQLKWVYLLFFLAICNICFAQWRMNRLPAPLPPTPEESNQAYLAKERTFFKPMYPYREIDGITMYAKGDTWVQFVGTVIELHPGKGVRVRGWYGAPMSWDGKSSGELVKSKVSGLPDAILPSEVEFFVTNFPFGAVEGTKIVWSQKLVAMAGGTYTYSTVAGSARTLPRLNFGTIIAAPQAAPLTDEQKEALKKSKAARDLKDMKREQELANSGSAYGLYKMGMRYLKGQGVETNRVRALELLGRASVLGQVEAKVELNRTLAEKTTDREELVRNATPTINASTGED